MERGPFLKLTNPKRYIPAVLGVLLLSEDPSEWMSLSERGLTSSSRLYWEYAVNLGTISDDGASRTVHVPRHNLFTVDALNNIMKTIGEGEGGL